MDIAELLAGFTAIARAILRGPFVQVRLLFETPPAWPLVLAAGLLTAFAWQLDRRERLDTRWPRVMEAVAGVFGVALLVWFFHAGQFPWAEGDWREEWTFFFAWKQALQEGSLPYYLATALTGTERYFANLQTPMVPYVFALAFMSVQAFVVLHLAIAYVIGFIGLVMLGFIEFAGQLCPRRAVCNEDLICASRVAVAMACT